MLKKVFVYDNRAIARKQLPLLIAMLACAVVACGLAFAMRFSIKPSALYSIVVSLYGMTLVGVICLPILCAFLVYSRFYRSLYTDEGYLTMVLPLNTHALLGGKLLAGLLWQLILTVLTVICLGIAIMPVGYEFVIELLSMLRESASAPSDPSVTIDPNTIGSVLLSIQTVIDEILSVAVGLLQIYTAICLGGGLFRRRKVLGAFLFAYLISIVTSLLQAIVSLPSAIGIFTDATAYMIWLNVAMLLQNLLYVALGFGMYFLTITLLRKKVNLE